MLTSGKFVKNRRILSGDTKLAWGFWCKWLPMLKDGMHFLPWQDRTLLVIVVVGALFVLQMYW